MRRIGAAYTHGPLVRNLTGTSNGEAGDSYVDPPPGLPFVGYSAARRSLHARSRFSTSAFGVRTTLRARSRNRSYGVRLSGGPVVGPCLMASLSSALFGRPHILTS